MKNLSEQEKKLYKTIIKKMGDVSPLRIARELKYIHKQPRRLSEIELIIFNLRKEILE